MTGSAEADVPLLEVEGLRVTYGGSVLALDGVGFAVPRGGAVALVGANGAGKTTALRAVTGLLRFHGGQVTRGTIRFARRSIGNADTASLVAAGIGQVLRTVNERGCALLLVEQSTALALRVTEQAYLLETGHVRAHAPTGELLSDERVRASYLGTPAVLQAQPPAA